MDRFPLGNDFRPYSWSPDGRWIAGVERHAWREDLSLLELREHKRRETARDGSSPAWLPDSRRLLFFTQTHLSLLDVQTGNVRPLLPVPRMFGQWGRAIALSSDGRTLVYLQSQSEGDIWLMSLREGR